MSDKPVVHIGENSPEEVAYKLMSRIRSTEKSEGLVQSEARKYLLDLYAECHEAVRGHRDFK